MVRHYVVEVGTELTRWTSAAAPVRFRNPPSACLGIAAVITVRGHRGLTSLDPEAVHNGEGAQRQAQQAQRNANGAVPLRRLPHVDEACGGAAQRNF